MPEKHSMFIVFNYIKFIQLKKNYLWVEIEFFWFILFIIISLITLLLQVIKLS